MKNNESKPMFQGTEDEYQPSELEIILKESINVIRALNGFPHC